MLVNSSLIFKTEAQDNGTENLHSGLSRVLAGGFMRGNLPGSSHGPGTTSKVRRIVLRLPLTQLPALDVLQPGKESAGRRFLSLRRESERASIAFVWTSAQPPPRQTLFLRAEARAHFKLRALLRKCCYRLRRRNFEGEPVPLRPSPPLSEGREFMKGLII